MWSRTSRSTIPWAADATSAPPETKPPGVVPAPSPHPSPEHLLVSGDIVILKSNTGMYFGQSTTQMRKLSTEEPSVHAISSEEGHSKILEIGGSLVQLTRRPTLTAALTSAVPMVVEAVGSRGPTVFRTGDTFTLRSMDPDLANHTYMTGEQVSIVSNVSGAVLYTKVSKEWPPSVWFIGWSASAGEEAKKPIELDKPYTLTSTYATGQLTHLTNEPLYQGTNVAFVNPLISEEKQTTWSFKRLGRLLAVPHVKQ